MEKTIGWRPVYRCLQAEKILFLNRVGEVEETTDAIIHLATAGFTTGVILPVDGGYVSGRA